MKSKNPNKGEDLKKSFEEDSDAEELISTYRRIREDNLNISRPISKEKKRWHYVGLIFILGLSSLVVLRLLCIG